jgi:F0F1-type ATP synthase assembly protein I
LTSIPFVLLVGPAIGYYLGTAADRRWSCGPWGMYAGILAGLAASARVTVQLIRQAQALNRDAQQRISPRAPR